MAEPHDEAQAPAASVPEDDEPDKTPAKRKGRGRKTAETIAQVATAIRQRDEIVANALDLLHASAFIDKATRDRIWAMYERGDARTRSMIQELIARVTRVRSDRLEDAIDPSRYDEEHLSGRALDALSQLPEVDPKAISDRVRGFGVDDLIARVDGRGKLFQALTQAPVVANKLRKQLIVVGIAVIIVVGVALLFPRYALYITLYGLLGILTLLGGLLIKWGWQIGRLAKKYDLDLGTLAKLPPEDRALIMGRRVWNRFVDTGRIGDAVERGLKAKVPDALQTRRAAPPARPKAQRPLPLDDTKPDAPADKARRRPSKRSTEG